MWTHDRFSFVPPVTKSFTFQYLQESDEIASDSHAKVELASEDFQAELDLSVSEGKKARSVVIDDQAKVSKQTRLYG